MKKKNFKWRIFKSPTVFSVMDLRRCDVLDHLINECLDSGIYSIKTVCNHYINITFKNGRESEFWNANKFYSWIMWGYITGSESRGGGRFRWSGSRPTRATMRRLDYYINEYYKSNPI